MSSQGNDQLCLTVSEAINKYIHENKENFRFAHFMFNHRQQRYMMYKLLDELEKMDQNSFDSAKKVGRIWWFYFDLHKAHAKVEEEYVHPTFCKATFPNSKEPINAKKVVEEVEAEHKSMDQDINEIDQKMQNMVDADDLETVDTYRNELLEKIRVFAKTYHKHVNFEELCLVPLLHQMDTESQDKLALEIKNFFQSRENGKQLLLGMRDIAISNPEDAEIWNNRMPWFVRNIIMFFLSFDNFYSEYVTLFPPPQYNQKVNDKYRQAVFE